MQDTKTINGQTGYLCTPRRANGERLTLYISQEDYAKLRRGRGWSAVITDLETGTTYHIKGAACSLPRCFCDAVITKEIPNN